MQELRKWKTFEEMRADLMNREPEESAAGPLLCACGSQILPDQASMEPEAIYCDRLYQYSLTSRERSYKAEGEWVYYTPKQPVFSALGPCPEKGKRRKVEKIQKIVAEYSNMRFDTFDNTLQLQAYQTCIAFTGNGKLILGGNTGVGKTHLARATYIAMLERFNDAIWFKADQLAELFRRIQSYSDDSIDKEKAQKHYGRGIKADAVFIDDLGSERETKSELFTEQLKSFLEELHGGLLITTNLDSTAMKDRYGEKIFSRLFEGAQAIRLTGTDYRSRSFPNLK